MSKAAKYTDLVAARVAAKAVNKGYPVIQEMIKRGEVTARIDSRWIDKDGNEHFRFKVSIEEVQAALMKRIYVPQGKKKPGPKKLPHRLVKC